jgi:ribonuclease HI
MYYAVAIGRTPGIFTSWKECYDQVNGFANATYKKYKTRMEAETFVSFHLNKQTNDIATTTTINDPFFPDYYVYTDGACSNNGSAKAVAGIGIFFSENDVRNVSRRVVGKQTNNVAELTAIIDTYPIIESDLKLGKKIAIISDSEYAIKCATTYGAKQSTLNYANKNTDIPNKELVKRVYELYATSPNIRFIHCKAHTNQTDIHSIGNDRADKLANESIGLVSCQYNHDNRINIVIE